MSLCTYLGIGLAIALHFTRAVKTESVLFPGAHKQSRLSLALWALAMLVAWPILGPSVLLLVILTRIV